VIKPNLEWKERLYALNMTNKEDYMVRLQVTCFIDLTITLSHDTLFITKINYMQQGGGLKDSDALLAAFSKERDL
jgi:hypothetical protein